jgi:hypothetical protein
MKVVGIIRPPLAIGGVFDTTEKLLRKAIEKEIQLKKDFLYKHVYLEATEAGRDRDIEKLNALKKGGVDIICSLGIICVTPTWEVFKDTNIPVIGTGYGCAASLFNKGLGECSKTHFTSVEYVVEPLPIFEFSKELFPNIKKIGIIRNENMDVDRLFSKDVLKLSDRADFSVESVEMKPDMKKDDIEDYELLYGITGAIEYLPKLIEWKRPVIMTINSKYDRQILGTITCGIDSLGEQIGEIVVRVIKGEDISKIPMQGPKRYAKHINTNIAKDLRLEITPGMHKYED